jgi:hypothetical protein
MSVALFQQPVKGILYDAPGIAEPVVIIGIERAPNYGTDRGDLRALIVDTDGLAHSVALSDVEFTSIAPGPSEQ